MKIIYVIILAFFTTTVKATTDEAMHYFKQGIQMQQQGKNSEAVNYFQRSVQLFESSVGTKNELTQGAKIYLARAHSSVGDIKSAIITISDVLNNESKIHGINSPEFASSLNDLGNFYGAIKEFDEARKVFERAYEINKKMLGSNNPDTIVCLESLIQVSADMNDIDNLVSYLKEEISVSETNLPVMTLQYLKSSFRLAEIYKNNSLNFIEATNILNKVYQKKTLFNSLTEPDKASLLHSLAEAYEFSGNYGEALPFYIKSVELYRKSLGNENNHTIVAINDLGSLYQAIGQPEMALPCSKEVYEIRKKYQKQNKEGYFLGALNYAASLQAIGEKEKALNIYKSLISSPEKIKEGSFEFQCLGNIYSNLGGLEKEFDKKVDYFRKSLEIAKATHSSNHPIISASLMGIAGIYLRNGNVDQALEYANEADNLIINNGGYNQINFQSLVTLYEIYKRKGDNQKAKECGLKYIEVCNKYLPVMLSLGETQRLTFSKDLSFGVPSEILDNNEIATLILNWKSTVIDSLLEDKSVSKKSGALSSGRLSAIQNLKTQIASLISKAESDSDNKIFSLQQKIDLIQSEMAKDSGIKMPVRNCLKSKYQSLISILQNNEVIIDFITYNDSNDESYYGVSLLFNGGNPIFIKLKNKEINMAIDLYRKAIAFSDEASLNSQIQILYDKLWKPISASLPADTKRIYIGPDGPLNFFSFATILDDQGKFISEKHQIAYIGSGKDLLRPAKSITNKRFAIYANPEFASHVSSKLKSQTHSPNPYSVRSADLSEFAKIQLPQLPGTKQEAEVVSLIAKNALWSNECHIGAAANKKALMAMKKPAILHLATHGFFLGGEEGGGMSGERGMKVAPLSDAPAPDMASKSKAVKISPMRQSGVALTGGQSTLQAWGRGEFPEPSDDGILTAEDVAGLDLDGTWIVTLSACETGLGQVQSGEGVFGLRRAFMMAGAQNLLMTLWPVSDEMTPKIMADFYNEALANFDAPGSLAKVQCDWLVKLRTERGLLAAVREAGPFAMIVMVNPNVKPEFVEGQLEVAPEKAAIPKSDKILEFQVALARADAGDAYAQAVVSIYYGLGLGCDQDPAKSKDYVMLSAKQQNPLGIYRLAEMRETGEGMDPNSDQAHQLMKKAKPGLQKLSSDPYALTALATIYEREDPESPKIREVLTKASEMGYEPAQEKLNQLPTN